jgi:hypothetical protein
MRWCLTDALESLQFVDPSMLTDKILGPFFEATAGGSQPPEAVKDQQYRYDQLAYLAGRVASRDQRVLAFLDNCVSKWTRVSLKGRAIKAVSAIYTASDGARFDQYKHCFERLASGDLSVVPLTQPLDPADATYLQLCALEALGTMGDLASLAFLREQPRNWTDDLQAQFFVTSEEIYLRNTPLNSGA